MRKPCHAYPALRGVQAFLALLLFVGCGGDGGGGVNPTVDARTPDASVQLDAGTTARPDAGGGAEPDARPLVDDAGCPLSTGPLPSLEDAGFPSDGLALWLRADRGVATTDGRVVCRWDDESGQGHGFRPTATPPTLAPTGIRDLSAVSFVGNQELSRGDEIGIDAASGRTVAVFGMATDTTHRFHYFIQGRVGTAGTYFGLDQNTFNTSGSLEGVYVTNNAFDSNLPTSGAARSHIFSISSFTPGGQLPNVLVYAVDGTPTTLSRRPGGLGNGTVEDFSGANFTAIGSADGTFGGAFIGEVMVWNRALNDTERAMVQSHFVARFPPSP